MRSIALRYGSLLFCALLGACSTLEDVSMPDWLGGGESKKPLPGERISVILERPALKPDAEVASQAFTLPSSGIPDFSGAFAEVGRVTIGGGAAWKESRLVPLPVAADGKVIAMDAAGIVAAYDAGSPAAALWTSDAATVKDAEDIPGGGLTVDGTALYVATGFGKVAALNLADGKTLWSVVVGVPVRGAPVAADGAVYVLGVDNQLRALDAATGATRWNYRGIQEAAGYLAMASPALSGGILVVPQTTGELVALAADSGSEGWKDGLVLSERTAASATLSGIHASPVIMDGTVYAIGSGGLLAANELRSGRRLWEQPLRGQQSPVMAGEWLFVLDSEERLYCLRAQDGSVRWVKELPRYEELETKTGTLHWIGPVLAGGTLYVVNGKGEMLSLAPDTGETKASHAVPAGVESTPVAAGGMLYLVTLDGTLHAYK